MTGLHFHRLTVGEVLRESDDALVVSFEVPAPLAETFSFMPGQYLTLKQGDLRRSYSICSVPGERLRVGVRRVQGGAFSTWLHAQLKAGDTLEVMEPQGHFGQAAALRPRHALLVAGGSGITPLLSILRTLLGRDAHTHCTLLYGNRTLGSTMFKEEIDDLKNRHLTRLAVHRVFSGELMDSPLHAGRIDGEKLTTFLRLAGPVDEAFVCGPHAMNDEVEAALQAAGIAPKHIHIERFGAPPGVGEAPPAAKAEDAVGARLLVVRDGVRREITMRPDESILSAAARAGLDVPYSCRSGVCATCRAKLLEGRVRMNRNFALEAHEVEAGFVLSCQAHPLSERVLVSYDER